MERRNGGGDDASAPTGADGPAPDLDRPRFDAVVRQLVDDRRWRRRVRMAHLRHWTAVVLRCGWNGLADVGCWFTCVPAQRCVPASRTRTTVSGPTRP